MCVDISSIRATRDQAVCALFKRRARRLLRRSAFLPCSVLPFARSRATMARLTVSGASCAPSLMASRARLMSVLIVRFRWRLTSRFLRERLCAFAAEIPFATFFIAPCQLSLAFFAVWRTAACAVGARRPTVSPADNRAAAAAVTRCPIDVDDARQVLQP